MLKRLSVAALVGIIAVASVPVTTSIALAQAGPEPPKGATPSDTAGASSGGGGSMEKSGSSSMKKGSMKKSSAKSKKKAM